MAPAVIAWDYQFAPNAQKTRNYLNLTGIPYLQCDQPFVLPRPILTNIGITYRRVPIVSIGKDVYCDNQAILAGLQACFPEKALARSSHDCAFETFGYRSFWMALPLVPAELVTKDLASDREALFSVFSRPDFPHLRQNSLAEFRSLLTIVEKDFLGHGGPWINGEQPGLADVHAVWIIKWALETLGVVKEPGLSREAFPSVYRWVEKFPPHDDKHCGQQTSAEDATRRLLSEDYAASEIGVDNTDPTALKAGAQVAVETNDDANGAKHPQKGKLIGLSSSEIVLQLEKGLRVHFPRIGYFIRAL